MIKLILGGARSGKSSFAEKIAHSLGEKDVIYLATAEIKDEEMVKRVAHHQQSRPQDWETIEEPYQAGKVLGKLKKGQVVLLDCITILISNLILDQEGKEMDKKEEIVMAEMETIIENSRKNDLKLILVSNEVGMGIIPSHSLGREYRDIAGRVNQYLAREASEVYLTCAGLPLEIKETGLNNLKKFQGDQNYES